MQVYMNPYINIVLCTGLDRDIRQKIELLDDKYTAFSTDTNCLFFKIAKKYYYLPGEVFLKDRLFLNKIGRLSYFTTNGGVVVQGFDTLWRYPGEITCFMDGGETNKIIFAPHAHVKLVEVFPQYKTVDYSDPMLLTYDK